MKILSYIAYLIGAVPVVIAMIDGASWFFTNHPLIITDWAYGTKLSFTIIWAMIWWLVGMFFKDKR